MNTENSNFIISSTKQTQPLLYNANNTQEHYKIEDIYGCIAPIILEYYYGKNISPDNSEAKNENLKTMKKETPLLNHLNIIACLNEATYKTSLNKIFNHLKHIALLFCIILIFLYFLHII